MTHPLSAELRALSRCSGMMSTVGLLTEAAAELDRLAAVERDVRALLAERENAELRGLVVEFLRQASVGATLSQAERTQLLAKLHSAQPAAEGSGTAGGDSKP